MSGFWIGLWAVGRAPDRQSGSGSSVGRQGVRQAEAEASEIDFHQLDLESMVARRQWFALDAQDHPIALAYPDRPVGRHRRRLQGLVVRARLLGADGLRRDVGPVYAQPPDTDQRALAHRVARLELEARGRVAQAARDVELAGDETGDLHACSSDGIMLLRILRIHQLGKAGEGRPGPQGLETAEGRVAPPPSSRTAVSARLVQYLALPWWP